jgi:hypothetical protein
MEWSASRVFGTQQPYMGKVAPKTLRAYLSAIRSVHLDRVMPVDVFENPSLRRLLDGATSLNPSPKDKARKLPILRPTLEKIATGGSSRADITLNSAFCLAFAGCLRMGEISYTEKQRAEQSFSATRVTRSDVKISSSGDHMTFRLKRSKTDKHKEGVQITIAATYDTVCPVAAMQRLLTIDPQPPSAPLFTAAGGAAFSAAYIRKALKSRLLRENIPSSNYTGHSFRKGAAQHATDNGFTDEEIQRLGRWTSEAFRLYRTTSQVDAFRLSQRFQIGTPTPITTRQAPPLAPPPSTSPTLPLLHQLR